jgi:hypothetical protein
LAAFVLALARGVAAVVISMVSPAAPLAFTATVKRPPVRQPPTSSPA